MFLLGIHHVFLYCTIVLYQADAHIHVGPPCTQSRLDITLHELMVGLDFGWCIGFAANLVIRIGACWNNSRYSSSLEPSSKYTINCCNWLSTIWYLLLSYIDLYLLRSTCQLLMITQVWRITGRESCDDDAAILEGVVWLWQWDSICCRNERPVFLNHASKTSH
jgi:hypothetical protein